MSDEIPAETVESVLRRQDAVQALLGVLNDIGGGHPWNYNVITEAAEDALAAALPHLLADRDDEIERLNEEVAYLRSREVDGFTVSRDEFNQAQAEIQRLQRALRDQTDESNLWLRRIAELEVVQAEARARWEEQLRSPETVEVANDAFYSVEGTHRSPSGKMRAALAAAAKTAAENRREEKR